MSVANDQCGGARTRASARTEHVGAEKDGVRCLGGATRKHPTNREVFFILTELFLLCCALLWTSWTFVLSITKAKVWPAYDWYEDKQ